jgi:hypothetical protein
MCVLERLKVEDGDGFSDEEEVELDMIDCT